MASSVLSITYRPLRIGMLVRPAELQDVMTAASLNTILWGGVYNPLIPIGENLNFARQLIRLFRVDALYPVADAPELQSFFAAHAHLAWPHSLPDRAGLFRETESGPSLAAVDILPWVIRRRERERGEPSGMYFVASWNDADSLAPVFVVTFGRFPTGTETGLRIDYKKAFAEGVGAQGIPISSDLPVPELPAFRISPVKFTGIELVPDSIHYWLHHGLYVGFVEPMDLITYWNLRASGIDLVFLPINSPTRFQYLATKHLENLVQWVKSGNAGWRSLGLWCRRGQAIAPEITRLFPADVKSDRYEVDEATWNGLSIRPPVFGLDRRSVLANLDLSTEGKPSLDLSLPREIDFADLPGEYIWQQWIISVDPLTEFGYEGHTLKLPFLPDLNEWYSRQVVFLPHMLRVETEGVGNVIQISEETLHLSPVAATDVVYRVLERAGIHTSASLPGRIAQQLIQQMGGLDGCRVFKIRGVRKLIGSDDAGDGVQKGRATEVIWDVDPTSRQPSFSRFENLHIEPREKAAFSPADAFNYLLKKGAFRPGLKLVCPRCTLDFWLGMPVPEICQCEYCGHSFAVAPYLEDRGDWRFRLSGLFGRKGGEEGAIPVVLTLLQLLRVHSLGVTFLYTCGTLLESEHLNCEVDLIVVQRSPRGFEPGVQLGEPAVLMGECKASAEIDDRDVENLAAAHEIVKQSGLRCYLLFAKTADSFGADEIHRFRTLAGQGISLILFTARELEPYEPYDGVPKTENLPVRHPLTFEELARNSSWLYLRDRPNQ